MLGSGSKGNAVLLESRESRVLVDAGFAPRTLATRLAAVGVAPESIDALVVTHEHIDHVRGACAGAKRWGWALHASAGTVRAHPELAAAGATTFEAGARITVGRFELTSVGTSHDAEEPVAVLAEADGARAVVATDMGWVTSAVASACAGADILVLESNHDEGMLRLGPYPAYLKARIAGRKGHLSNVAAAAFARAMTHRDLRHLVLAHLSETNNAPEVALDTMRVALRGTRFRGGVCAAPQDGVLGPFCPGSERARVASQLALAL